MTNMGGLAACSRLKRSMYFVFSIDLLAKTSFTERHMNLKFAQNKLTVHIPIIFVFFTGYHLQYKVH